MVELVPNGGRYADGNTDLLHQIQLTDSTSSGTIRLSGFLPYTEYSMQVTDYEATTTAVQNAGADAASVLHEIDKEYAPFYCRHCLRPYCGQHWQLKATFDHGFDYYSGSCPYGHRKFIDH
ncbi:hypothetical protein GCM10010191_89530 [Actinomadura vinacea]|uniref:Uncharacterized protein n=2 Tax=Actinomadura vinacea TaxID=115336 RepID=A0ABN3KGF5_9ACTN